MRLKRFNPENIKLNENQNLLEYYTNRISKRKLRTEMISKPQNDFKHTGHVGIDGATFGDIAFLGSSQNVSYLAPSVPCCNV